MRVSNTAGPPSAPMGEFNRGTIAPEAFSRTSQGETLCARAQSGGGGVFRESTRLSSDVASRCTASHEVAPFGVDYGDLVLAIAKVRRGESQVARHRCFTSRSDNRKRAPLRGSSSNVPTNDSRTRTSHRQDGPLYLRAFRARGDVRDETGCKDGPSARNGRSGSPERADARYRENWMRAQSQQTWKADAEEYEIFQKHPGYGKDILSPIKFLRPLIPGVHLHHERWDGRGYPLKLQGNDIPVIARIIAVADTYDAMTSDRAYRSALPHDVAVGEIERCAKSQFDPDVAGIFCEELETYRDEATSRGEKIPE